MRALVLGATGHIGAHVVRALLAEGHEVRAAFRSERRLGVLEGLPVQRVRVDLDTLEGLPGSLEGCDWVFHAAGYYPGFRTRRAEALAKGVESTRRVLDAFREAKPRRIVFTSSAAVIPRTPGRAANESDVASWPLKEWWPLYATVKLAMEHEVLSAQRAGLPIVVVNPSICIGEYDAHRFSGRVVLIFSGHRVPFYVEYCINAIYTGDVGIGHVRAAERGRLGERYLLTCQEFQLREFAELVTRVGGGSPPRWRVPYRVVHAAAWTAEAVARLTGTEPLLTRQGVEATRTLGKRLDGSKAVRELGLPQTPIEEAVRRAIDWFRGQASRSCEAPGSDVSLTP